MSDFRLAAGLAAKIKTALAHFYGRARISAMEYVIDCDKDPYLPNGWTVPEGHHLKGGQWKWDPKQVSLWLVKDQHNGKAMAGDILCKQLAGKPVLNANVLDYLLANTQLIPKEWKVDYIFFWGTIYRNAGVNLYVRYLYYIAGCWGWRCGWDNPWGDGGPAALRAS